LSRGGEDLNQNPLCSLPPVLSWTNGIPYLLLINHCGHVDLNNAIFKLIKITRELFLFPSVALSLVYE